MEEGWDTARVADQSSTYSQSRKVSDAHSPAADPQMFSGGGTSLVLPVSLGHEEK